MTNLPKLTKLIEKLQDLAARLDEEKDLVVHQRVNQFYYLEKTAELKILQEQFEEAEMKINQLTKHIECEYALVYNQWRKDIRWLNSPSQREFKTIL